MDAVGDGEMSDKEDNKLPGAHAWTGTKVLGHDLHDSSIPFLGGDDHDEHHEKHEHHDKHKKHDKHKHKHHKGEAEYVERRQFYD